MPFIPSVDRHHATERDMGTISEEDEGRRLALSVAEAAIEAGVGRDQVYAAIRDGRLQARKWGRRTLITCEAFDRFLNGLPSLRLPQRPD
jgi:excisionase family DNA binding protein